MNAAESTSSGAFPSEINEFMSQNDENERENEEIDNESGDLNSQDGEDDNDEVELSPKLAEGFFEIETVRRKRVRKGQVQYLIKWRGWPETANTWEPYENLVSCFDVIEAFEEGLRSGKHRSRKRKRRSSGLVPQAKKKIQGTPVVSSSSPLTAGRVRFDEGNYIIPFVGDVNYEDGGRLDIGDFSNGDAIEHGNGNGSVAISPQVEEEKNQYKMDVNLGESTGIQFTNGDSSLLAINNLESQSCFENGHQKVDGEGLVQANGRLRKRRKAASVKRFNQDQTLQTPRTPRVTNYAGIEQANGNEIIDITPEVEERRDHYEMHVNPGEYAGTPLINGGSSRVAVDILELKTSEAISLENGDQKVDGEGLVQANGRLRNRRKAVSVKRFNQEQTPCVTNYAAQDLTTKNTRTCNIAGQNWDKNSAQRSKSDNSTDTFSITEIIKPISFSSSGSVPDILVTFMAKRSDGKEVMVDNKYLKANYPLLLINYYEQHLNYNATAGPDRSGRAYMAR